MICDRCKSKTVGTIMSIFNDDIICLQCKADERLTPGYHRASTAEMRSLMRGEMDFPGIGLEEADLVMLEHLRQQRGIHVQ